MAKKSDQQLTLADKIDAARTLFKLRQRSEYRRRMSEIEAAIEDQHNRELAEGKLTEIDFGDPADLLLTENSSATNT